MEINRTNSDPNFKGRLTVNLYKVVDAEELLAKSLTYKTTMEQDSFLLKSVDEQLSKVKAGYVPLDKTAAEKFLKAVENLTGLKIPRNKNAFVNMNPAQKTLGYSDSTIYRKDGSQFATVVVEKLNCPDSVLV